jgi:hypothetical protein
VKNSARNRQWDSYSKRVRPHAATNTELGQRTYAFTGRSALSLREQSCAVCSVLIAEGAPVLISRRGDIAHAACGTDMKKAKT